MRRRLATCGLLVAAATLTGCTSERDRFCDEVEAQQDRLTDVLGSGSPDALIQALPSLQALRADAPRDIRDEYDVVVRAIEGLRDALAEADVDPAGYDREDLSELPAEDRERIRAAATELGSSATRQAFEDLEQQARDVCRTPLTL